MDCYHDYSFLPEVVSEHHPNWPAQRIVRAVDDTLGVVRKNMIKFDHSAQKYRTFLNDGTKKRFPVTQNRHFDRYFKNAWKKDAEALGVILSMLHPDPKQRATAYEVVATMQEPSLKVTPKHRRELASVLQQRPEPAQTNISSHSPTLLPSSRLMNRGHTTI